MSSPLRTEQLTKVFRHVDAVRDLNIEVPEGSVFALVGPNGAGKTTPSRRCSTSISPPPAAPSCSASTPALSVRRSSPASVTFPRISRCPDG